MVENRRSLVVLRDPDGETLKLPASPAGQSTRYGKKPYALVLEGGEVLFVKPRSRLSPAALIRPDGGLATPRASIG